MFAVDLAQVIVGYETLTAMLAVLRDRPDTERWSVQMEGSNTTVHFSSGPSDTIVISVEDVEHRGS